MLQSANFQSFSKNKKSQWLALLVLLMVLWLGANLSALAQSASAPKLSITHSDTTGWEQYSFPGALGFSTTQKDLVTLATSIPTDLNCTGTISSGSLTFESYSLSDTELRIALPELAVDQQVEVSAQMLPQIVRFSLSNPIDCAQVLGKSLLWEFINTEQANANPEALHSRQLQNIAIQFDQQVSFFATSTSTSSAIPQNTERSIPDQSRNWHINNNARLRKYGDSDLRQSFRVQLFDNNQSSELSNAPLKGDNLLRVGNFVISSSVSNSEGKTPFNTEIALLPTGELLLEVQNQANFQPGKYNLELHIEDASGYRETLTQDFYWGVLAINTNRDTFFPGQIADIWMSVLDDEGYAVCDANLALDIIKPNGQTVSLSTSTGEIKLSPECAPANFTYSHDFSAKFLDTNLPGSYTLELTTTTPNGTRKTSSNFIVSNDHKFSIARKTASRIYPIHDYDVQILVSTYSTYQGVVKEYVPRVFEIRNTSANVREFNSELWELSWEVNWEAGKEYSLDYSYNPPDLSPQFYTLGELQIGAVYRELNQWQIASDATTGQVSAGSGANNAAVGTAAWSNPGRVTAADASFSQVLLARNQISNYLQASNFGFAIPGGATINGIQVDILRREGGLGSNMFIRDNSVFIVKGGVIGTTNRANTTADWPTAAAYASYGSNSDLWGQTWTAADINSGNFGVVISATNIRVGGGLSILEDAQVDHIRITVDYTPNNIDLRQQRYRWRADDGNETAATSLAGENAPLTRQRNVNTRLRFLVENQGTLPASNYAFRLEYGLKSTTCSSVSSWTTVPASATSEAFQAVASTHFTNGANSTNVTGLLTDPATTFVTGRLQSTTALTSALTVSNAQFTEIEYNILANNNATNGQTYCFRLTNAGSTMNFAYTAYAEWLVGQANITQSHYRWRNDNGDETTGTLLAGYIQPNGDFSANWLSATPAGLHFANIDDNVVSPAAPNTADYISDDNDRVDEFEMTTLTASTPYIRADVYLYVRTIGNEELDLNLVINGTAQTAQRITPTTSYQWMNVSFTGLTMSQTQLDGLRVRFTQVKNGASSNVDVAAMYVAVYETGTAATWMANEDTTYSTFSKLTNFRLRTQTSNTGSVSKNSNINLQFAQRVGLTCGDDESFTTVTSSTSNDIHLANSNFLSDAEITTGQLTPTGTFTAGRVIAATGSGFANVTLNSGVYTELEYVLQARAAAAGGFYCFRLVDNNTPIDIYSVYPVIEIAANQQPNTPSNVAQLSNLNVSIAEGGWINTTTVRFNATGGDVDSTDNIRLCVEAIPVSTPFTGVPTACSAYMAYTGSAISLSLDITGMAAATTYHWQARIEDDGGLSSAWTSFGNNSESHRDFGIDQVAPSGGTVLDGISIGSDYDANDGSLSQVSANWSGISDLSSDIASYEYAIGTSSGGNDLVNWTPLPGMGDLFNASNETADFSEWDATQLDNGDLAMSYTESSLGLYSMSATIDDTNVAWARKDLAPQSEIFARLMLNTGSLNMVSGDTFVIQELSENGIARAQVELNHNGSNFRARAVLRPADKDTSWVNLNSGWNTIEIHWRADNNAALDFWVNSNMSSTATANTASQAVNAWRVGAVGGLDTGTSGQYYLDSFAASSASPTLIQEAYQSSITVPGHLRTGQEYFFSVRATDNAGNVSVPMSSDGFTVLPEFSFSTSTNSLNFVNLSPSNSWSDSQSMNLQTSTNTYGGYVIRAYATQPFTNTLAPSYTIPDFAGSNLAPLLWTGTGFGYTTNDANLSGGTANRFTNGGTKYAALVYTSPGDIVADHTSSVSGATGPVTNELFNLIYRVTAPANQAAGPYSTQIVYVATPIL